MKFTSTKQTPFNTAKTTRTLIGFTVFLTILVLGSCGLAKDTAPPNDPPGGSTTFQQDLENATNVPNLATANALTREVLTPLGVATGTLLVKRYVTETGAGSYNGSSWTNAWAATNLRNGINTISDATANKVYLVMVAGATYKPDYSTTTITATERAISFGMKNHVAIMGGFDPVGDWGRTGTTMFSGDIGTAGDSTDNSYHVFSHTSITLGNAHLYGVTITNGNANVFFPQNAGGGMYNNGSSPVLTKVVFSGNSANVGGGMYNEVSSSPVLTEVVFSGNTAIANGGGMANDNSSPVLTRVVFSGNTATGTSGGGGMYNANNSSPVLTEVVFSGNTAGFGGGMYNTGSSPVLTEVVFSGNTANSGGGMFNADLSPVLTSVVFSGNTATSTTLGGGGMYNNGSSPVIIGAVFINNTAANGGGMLNENGGTQAGPLIVNTIFLGNTLSGMGSGTNIVMDRGGLFTGTENIRIAGSVLGIGLAQPTNGIVGYSSGGGSAALNITYHSLANGAVNFGADANLTINGMNFPYPTIQSTSSARNLGLFVRRSGTTYYFSEDESTWYTGFTSTGAGGLVTVDTPPANATDLTATDIADNPRNGRPDAGVYEVR